MSEHPPGDPGAAPDRPDAGEPVEYAVAERLGRSLGRFARAARAAARVAQPEAERAARQARSAAEAARPRIQRAAGEALERTGQFLQEHDDELRRAAGAGARAVVTRSTPPLLRPVITAATDELTRPRPPSTTPSAEAPSKIAPTPRLTRTLCVAPHAQREGQRPLSRESPAAVAG